MAAARVCEASGKRSLTEVSAEADDSSRCVGLLQRREARMRVVGAAVVYCKFQMDGQTPAKPSKAPCEARQLWVIRSQRDDNRDLRAHLVVSD